MKIQTVHTGLRKMPELLAWIVVASGCWKCSSLISVGIDTNCPPLTLAGLYNIGIHLIGKLMRVVNQKFHRNYEVNLSRKGLKL